MCQHNRKIKQFCLFPQCTHKQAAGCPQCFRLYHSHTNYPQILREENIAPLLKRLNLSQNIREQRKEVTMKLHKLLITFKNEINLKLEDMINSMIGKLKYPFLYHSNLLEVYRFLRDKDYSKITPTQLQHFYKISVNIKQDEFISRDSQYFQAYLYSIQADANTWMKKMRDIERLLDFSTSAELNQLEKDWISHFHQQQKNTKRWISQMGNIKTPIVNTANNFSHICDISVQNTRIKSAQTLQNDCTESLKSKQQKQSFGLFSPKVQKPEQQRKFDAERPKSAVISKQYGQSNESAKAQQKPSLLNIEKEPNGLHLGSSRNISKNQTAQITKKYMEKNEKTKESNPPKIDIEKGTPKKEEVKQKKMKKQIIQIIKTRQENIKKRLEEMMKTTEQSTPPKINQNNDQKPIQDNPSPQKTPPTSLKQNPRIQDSQLLKKYLQEAPVFKTNPLNNNTQVQPHLTRKGSYRQNQSTDSLNKNISRNERNNKEDPYPIIDGTITKEIPITNANISPKKSFQNRQINTESVTEEREIELAAIFCKGLSESRRKDKMYFLENYLSKHTNNISAVQCLSYLYIQQGKLKECLTLTNSYLDKLSAISVNPTEKTNLIINKSAALNLLGRYSETITLLLETNLFQNDKVQKNIADAYHNVGMTDKAIYHYEKAIKLNAKFDEAYYNLSVLLYLQQGYCNAKINIAKALQINPEHPNYRQLLTHLEQKMSSLES